MFTKKERQLLIVLILTFLLPTVYKTFRIYLLGNLSQEWGVNIASQIAWLDVVFEVFQEGLILPLFYLIGQSFDKENYHQVDLSNKIQTGLITSGSLVFIIVFFSSIFLSDIATFMGQTTALIPATVRYMRLEMVAILLSVLFSFAKVVLISLGQIKTIGYLLVCKVVVNLISDTFLLSSLPISFNIGVDAIAIGNILSDTILLTISLIQLNKMNLLFKNKILSFAWQKKWAKVGSISGLESFIRNAIFALIILRMINQVQEQGTFWLANNFIWGWLLIPVLALGELIKKKVSKKNTSNQEIQAVFKQGIQATCIICMVWLVTFPFWESFLRVAFNVENVAPLFFLIKISIAFYVVFALNNVVDSIFYGLGRTDLMLYQSIATNILFYSIAYFLYLRGVWQPTLNSIAILFGLGIVFDSLVTFIIYFVLKNKLINIDYEN
ncbi:MAG: hypothetical protein JXQ26_10250 [Tissierellales bacterium]|nr:hypothetical protein [Tissierellales bacterium]MBN2828364.1 hypothetical protein [Tissierellales bacterium]